jgi:hypothetical protein
MGERGDTLARARAPSGPLLLPFAAPIAAAMPAPGSRLAARFADFHSRRCALRRVGGRSRPHTCPRRANECPRPTGGGNGDPRAEHSRRRRSARQRERRLQCPAQSSPEQASPSCQATSPAPRRSSVERTSFRDHYARPRDGVRFVPFSHTQNVVVDANLLRAPEPPFRARAPARAEKPVRSGGAAMAGSPPPASQAKGATAGTLVARGRASRVCRARADSIHAELGRASLTRPFSARLPAPYSRGSCEKFDRAGLTREVPTLMDAASISPSTRA